MGTSILPAGALLLDGSGLPPFEVLEPFLGFFLFALGARDSLLPLEACPVDSAREFVRLERVFSFGHPHSASFRACSRFSNSLRDFSRASARR